jgi:hypothetical protein
MSVAARLEPFLLVAVAYDKRTFWGAPDLESRVELSERPESSVCGHFKD